MGKGPVINVFTDKRNCDLSVCSKNGVSQTGVKGMPRAIRFGDHVTWTTAPDFNGGGIAGAVGGAINVIEMWGYYPSEPNDVKQQTQAATSSGKAGDPGVGRWQINPVNPALVGQAIQYGNPEHTFYLWCPGSNANFRVGTKRTSWPQMGEWTQQGNYFINESIDAELMFVMEHADSAFNTYPISSEQRANSWNHVFYGDLLAFEVMNSNSEHRGDVLWIMQQYYTDQPTEEQAGWGTTGGDGFPGIMWPVYPFQTSVLKPTGDSPGRNTTTYWNTNDYSYNFMMWPDGTIGYSQVNEENSCACQCQALVNQQNGTGSNGDWQFCARSGQFSTCGLAKDGEYRWSSCNVVLSCQTGKLGPNTCGDLPAQNILPGDTVACCDPVEQKWKARSPSAPEGVAYACVYDKTDSANYAKATEQVDQQGCKQTIWQCRPPETNAVPLKPLLDTPARAQWRASQRKSASGSSSLLPLGPTQEGAMNSQFTCDIQDKPILLCANSS